MRCILLFILFFLAQIVSSQSELFIGEWESHLPNKRGIAITQNEEKVFYASDFGLISVDKQDGSRTFLDKVNGLSDVGISKLGYNASLDILILAYKNGKIDLIKGSEIKYISDLFTNSNISGSREINAIETKGDFAYFSTDFGLVQYNLNEQSFGFTCFTDVIVNDVISINDIVFMSTEDGLFSFDLNSNLNPSDFNVWTYYDEGNGLDVLYEGRSLHILNDDLYFATADKVYRFNQSSFEIAYTFENDQEIKFISNFNDSLLIGSYENNIDDIDLSTLGNNSIRTMSENCSSSTNDAIQDQYGVLWLADDYSNLRYIDEGECKIIYSQGPFSFKVSEMALVDGSLYAVSGGVTDNYTNAYVQSGYYVLNEEGKWKNQHLGNNAFLSDNELVNLFTIAKHPTEPVVMLGSFYNGLIEYNTETDTYHLWDQFNSSLQGSIGDGNRTRVSGLAYDDQGNLWVSNHLASKPLSVYTAEKEWISFDVPQTNKLAAIAIDHSNRKWILVEGLGGGVLVFDEEDGFDTANSTVLLTKSNSEIEAEKSFSIEADREGSIWLGTRVGPVAYNCGSNVFDLECLGDRRLVTQDDILAVLLATEDVRTMAFDGANRMWVGTQNGIFVLSPDTKNQIYHYTAENSPLFDNGIVDLLYNGDSGVMYIATNKGIMAIRSESTKANRTHSSNVYAFPNPVDPNYEGPIAIKGLAEDANVKITDVNGLLVYETTALGGQAIWDGFDYLGNRASSGVYLVFSATTDTFQDIDTYVTKILVVR